MKTLQNNIFFTLYRKLKNNLSIFSDLNNYQNYYQRRINYSLSNVYMLLQIDKLLLLHIVASNSLLIQTSFNLSETANFIVSHLLQKRELLAFYSMLHEVCLDCNNNACNYLLHEVESKATTCHAIE